MMRYVGNKRVKKRLKKQEVESFGPPSFATKGPLGQPCSLELDSDDQTFVLETQRSPRAFSALAHEFSGLDCNEETPLRSDHTLPRNQPRPPPSPVGASSSRSCQVCSKRGRNLGWNIADFCEGCDAIAKAALAADP